MEVVADERGGWRGVGGQGLPHLVARDNWPSVYCGDPAHPRPLPSRLMGRLLNSFLAPLRSLKIFAVFLTFLPE